MDRREKREWLVKLVYQNEMNEDLNIDEKTLFENHDIELATDLGLVLKEIKANNEKIEGILEKYINIPMSRISKVDLAILKTSIYEFVISKTVPSSVSINEAVEISKKYSTESAYKFVNGVLSSVVKHEIEEQ